MKKMIIVLLSFLLIVGCSSSFDSGKIFVTVDGTQFKIGGQPYYFVGANMWYGCYLGSTSEEYGDRERLIRELDVLKENGINNLRILGASEACVSKNVVSPAIIEAPGQYNASLLVGLDFLLAEMAKRDMYAVVYLNNFWEWSGGMAQHLAWAGEELVSPTTHGWQKFMENSGTFYTNEKANQQYLDYIRFLVNRKNTITGELYKNDPTIMSWQLANEPRPGNGPSGHDNVENFYKWIDTTAKYIHSLDSNHLVSTGNEGTMGCLGSEEYYVRAHSFDNIDYMTFHMWAKNWGWFDANDMEGTFPGVKENAIAYIGQHLQFARKIGKPTTIEEFGLGRDFEKTDENMTTNYRDQYFAMVFSALQDSAAAGAPIAGSNFWAWGGEGRAQHDDDWWRPGDPFVGDPPQEPQGLNSIYHTDESTLSILKAHGEKMQALCK